MGVTPLHELLLVHRGELDRDLAVGQLALAQPLARTREDLGVLAQSTDANFAKLGPLLSLLALSCNTRQKTGTEDAQRPP